MKYISVIAAGITLLGGVAQVLAQDSWDVDEIMSREFADEDFDTYLSRDAQEDPDNFERAITPTATWGTGQYKIDMGVYRMAVNPWLMVNFLNDYGTKFQKACGKNPELHVDQAGVVWPSNKGHPNCTKKNFYQKVPVTLGAYAQWTFCKKTESGLLVQAREVSDFDDLD
ncbi:hypothetical protein CPC08DRAFT_818128 [Agrocybe pediades]|nr:hypothetical protein CPC08DRAFT_818128 [Agrocybe pediades]